MPPSFFRTALLAASLACLTLPACKSNKLGPDNQPEQPPAPTAEQPPAPTAEQPPAPRPVSNPAADLAQKRTEAQKRTKAERAARAALQSWLQAQNHGNPTAYHALYHQRLFKGIRRTHDGKVKRFDAPGWRADREKMFKLGKLEVAADDISVATWLDSNSKLKPGVIITRFIQRWRGGNYADHGVKVLHWWRDRQGQLRLIYEDLLNSERGWDRSPDADLAVATMTLPKNHPEALAAWRKLAPTGADYHDKLATIPAGQVAQTMAHAIILDDDHTCDEILEYDQCGDLYTEFKPLSDQAGFDNPCLRRRLALWSLDQLTGPSIDALIEPLTATVATSEPQNEIQEKILVIASKASEKNRLALLLSADKELAASQISGLSDASLIELYRQHSMDEAIEALSADSHQALLIQALGDEKLRSETRGTILDALASVKNPAMTKALLELARGDDCSLAMAAAEMLAARGDPSHLPTKPNDGGSSEHAWTLCLLLHASDDDRALAVWRSFFPPKDSVDVVDEYFDPYEFQLARSEYEAALESGEATEQDDPPEPPGDDADDDTPGLTRSSRQIQRASATLGDLDPNLGHESMSCDGATCTADTDHGNYTVTFEVGTDGVLYLSELRNYIEGGCDC